MIECPVCMGLGKTNYMRQGAQVTDVCYRCAGLGKVKPLQAKQQGGASFGAVLQAEDNAAKLARQEKWDYRMLDLATLIAGWSKDPGTKVGAVIAHGNRVVSTGYNGFPSRLKDDALEQRDRKLSRTIHAELNAMFNAQRSVAGFTLYSTFPCCDRCAAHIVAAGITRVVWKVADVAAWSESAKLGEQYFHEAGIQCTAVHY